MGVISKLVGKIDVSEFKFKKKVKEEKPSLLKDLMNCPDEFKLEAFVENGEIIVKIMKRDV